MYVVRLPDGTLRVPHSVLGDPARGEAVPEDGEDGERIIAQAYVEIGPDDPDYARLLPGSVTEEELERKRREWREGDAELLRTFEEWKAEREGS